ncbi:MAG TPA: arginase family protein [Nitrososphaeraceae archaeon]
MQDLINIIQPLFRLPEKTASKASFGDMDLSVTYESSDAILFGVPLELTTTFGKGTSKGPEAIRSTSAYQIETYVFEEKVDLKKVINILDVGDFIIPKVSGNMDKVNFVLSYLDKYLPSLTKEISLHKKIPIVLGGEHTISYFFLKGLIEETPLLIHFDAHRDMKSEYGGRDLCHTTPFFRLIHEGYLQGRDIIQIGIRQADEVEDNFAKDQGVTTFDAWDLKENTQHFITKLSQMTRDRNIYVSFDIDVYDIPFVPCTGTPEPFGLDPFTILKIIDAIHYSANLIGMDMVEVSLKNNDFREGTLATQTLLRILTRKFVRKNILHQ